MKQPEKGPFPPKPTREAATGASSPEELLERRGGSVDAARPEWARETGRQEVGSARDSQRHPPHLTENDEDAPLQAENESPGEVPALPANAAGSDKLDTSEQAQEIREESMYDQRPSQDKDQPPSESAR
jgi:hypothetical protein